MDASTTPNDANDQTWETFKEIIRDLYLVQNQSLEQVTKELNDSYHFPTSKAQVEYRCKKWNFRKSLTKAEWNVVTQRIKQRKRDGKESEVFVEGWQMDPKKVKKAISRYGSASAVIQVPSPPPLEGITIRTPELTPVAEALEGAQTPVLHIPFSQDSSTFLIGTLPFAIFKSKTDFADKLVGVTGKDDSTLRIKSNNVQAELVARLGFGIARNQPQALHQIVEMLMTQDIRHEDSVAQTAALGAGWLPTAQLLNFVIFMLSNEMITPTAEIHNRIYQLLKCHDETGLLEHILSIKGSTSEALVEQIFRIAVEQGDTRTVRKVLQADLGIDRTLCLDGYDKITPLQKACELFNVDLVRVLIDAGADVNYAPEQKLTPLMIAVSRKNNNGYIRNGAEIDLIKILLQAGANVNPELSHSSLTRPAAACDMELISLLLENGANQNITDVNHYSDIPLFAAIESYHSEGEIVAVVQRLIQSGADINTPRPDLPNHFYSPLMIALKTGHTAVVRALIDAGARLHCELLITAAEDGAMDMVKLLIDCGAQISSEAIRSAIRGKNPQICLFLLSCTNSCDKETFRSEAFVAAMQFRDVGVPIDSRDGLEAAIEGAAGRGDVAILRLLLNKNSKDPAAAIESLGSSLYLAIVNRRYEVIELLLGAGADPDTPYEEYDEAGDLTRRSSPLLAAICRKEFQLVQRLLSVGASVSKVPVLPAAVSWGCTPLIKDIIDAGAEIDAPETSGPGSLTALAIAVADGDLALTHKLIEAGADVNSPAAEATGRTALTIAVENNDIEMIDELLRLGAVPSEPAMVAAVHRGTKLTQRLLANTLARFGRCPQSSGTSAMRLAIAYSNTATIELLIKSGINPNIIVRHKYSRGLTMIDNESPLGTALRLSTGDDLKILKILLDGGANPDGIVSDEHTALLMAIKAQNLEAVKVLVAAGASINKKPSAITRAPLQLAVEKGATDIVGFLLDNGADVNSPPHTRYGATALQFAAIKGYMRIGVALLENGAIVDAPSAVVGGRTALEGASEHGRIDMVQLLVSAGAQLTGPGSAQYEQARTLATENGHMAVRRLLERTHSEQMEYFADWSIFTDFATAENTGLGF